MCKTAVGGTVIVSPEWECGPVDFGENQVEAEDQGECDLALFLRCGEAVAVSVVIERTDMSGTVWPWKGKREELDQSGVVCVLGCVLFNLYWIYMREIAEDQYAAGWGRDERDRGVNMCLC
jgi:hypothetical protein